MIFDTT